MLGLRVALIASVAVALTGCSGSLAPIPTPTSDEYPSFNRPQVDGDRISDDEVTGDYLPDSVHYAGEVDTVRFFIAQMETGERCVLIDDPNDAMDGFSSGCGGGDVKYTIPGVATAAIVPISAPTPRGWSRIDENLMVQVP